MNRIGYVYIDETYVGEVKEDDKGFSFAYATEYLNKNGAKPVSLTLPLRRTPYRSLTMLSFFDGLIPEGWLMTIAEKKLEIRCP